MFHVKVTPKGNTDNAIYLDVYQGKNESAFEALVRTVESKQVAEMIDKHFGKGEKGRIFDVYAWLKASWVLILDIKQDYE